MNVTAGDRRTIRHCGWTSAGTRGHTGGPVGGWSIIGDVVSYGDTASKSMVNDREVVPGQVDQEVTQ